MSQGIVLVLDNVRSVENVGSIFRTADAVGVKKIFLLGLTPAPLDRFGRVRQDLHKTALGAEEYVPWQVARDGKKLLRQLKKDGYFLVALEQTLRAIPYAKFQVPTGEMPALIVGNEKEGVEKNLLALADATIHIPMRGKKESLNVAVATGIALYHITQFKD